MKWDIDKSLREFEAEILPGTNVSRALVDVHILEKQGVRLTPEQKKEDRQSVVVWSLAIGQMHRPKAFFYGQTIRQCYLRARKAVKKAKNGVLLDVWGGEISLPKAAKKARR